ncbi:phenylacetate--CoA ligase family protein [Candidatus Bipolaricaulota bacterium]
MFERVGLGRNRGGLSLSSGFRRRLYRVGLANSGLGPTKAHYQELMEGDTAELSARYQRSILQHAQSHVPYYQRLSLADDSLESFPILSKAALRQSRAQLTSQGLKTDAVANVLSGGSTGEPVEVLMDQRAQQWDLATGIYYRHALLGIEPDIYLDKRKVWLWSPRSRIRGRINNYRLRIGRLVSRTTYLDLRVISRTILNQYARKINRLRPIFLTAFSIPLYELAQHARREGIRMHRPLMIFTSGTTLFPTMRRHIEDTFGCQVYDGYGSRETGNVAGECSHGNLHVFTFNNTVEVVDSNGRPSAANQKGRLLVTSLQNYAMPLIRYEIGDVGTVGSGACECGSPLPFLNHIAGRMLEYFPTRDGSLVSGGYFFQLLYGCSWISEYQVLQEDLDRIVISYTRTQDERRHDEDLQRIVKGIRDKMGDDCVVEWRELDSIPRTRHGKRLFTRSLVWEDCHTELLQDMTADPESET